MLGIVVRSSLLTMIAIITANDCRGSRVAKFEVGDKLENVALQAGSSFLHINNIGIKSQKE